MSDIEMVTKLFPRVKIQSNENPDSVKAVQELREGIKELKKAYKSVHSCQMEAAKGPHMFTKKMELKRVKTAQAESTYVLAIADFYQQGEQDGRNAKEQQKIKTMAVNRIKRDVIGWNKNYIKSKDLQKAYRLLEGGEIMTWYNTMNNEFLTYLKDYFFPYGIHLKWDTSKSYGDDQLFQLVQKAIDHYIRTLSKSPLTNPKQIAPAKSKDAQAYFQRCYTQIVIPQRLVHIANTRMYHLLQLAEFANAASRTTLRNKFKKAAFIQQLELSNLTTFKECIYVLGEIAFVHFWDLYTIWMPQIESFQRPEQLLEFLPEFEGIWLKKRIKSKFIFMDLEIKGFTDVIKYHTQLILNILYKERKIADTQGIGDTEAPYWPITAPSFREAIKDEDKLIEKLQLLTRQLKKDKKIDLDVWY